MKRDHDTSWLKDWRFAALVGILAGFLVGLLTFGQPWHLQPNWGDLPTWLLFALGLPGIYQLRVFVRTNAEEARRNVKRDELLDRQLAEAEARARTERRSQAEDVEVNRDGGDGLVTNASRRPITDVTCSFMSSVDRHLLARPEKCGILGAVSLPNGRVVEGLSDPKPVQRFERLRPGSRCHFAFKDGLKREPDFVLVAWFTDDAGFRWQLDEYLHLVQVDNGSDSELEYHQ